ncbi:MAG: VRR-NUC domain-containing protein, partial [Gammaproteobacteria bacterium]|nr:VRR-NUC domain-containing protein [Gammaproteobacteria bacterium]
CVDPLMDSMPLIQRLEQTFEQKFGISNPLVNWKIFDKSVLETIVRCMGEEAIRKLLQLMLPDLRQMRSGFPDLFVVMPDDTFEFIEVKGPTDQVRPNQHIWLQALASMELPVSVLKYKAVA